MDVENLQLYRQQIKSLPKLYRQNITGVLINKLQYESGKTKDILAASQNLSHTEIVFLCGRLDNIISLMQIGRHYLLESVQAEYELTLDTIDVTRLVNLYTANLWYNSVIDSIYQFYFLMQNADKITDDNYEQKLKVLRDDKTKKKVIKRIVNDDEREGFESLIKNMKEVNHIANNIKHRSFNIYSHGHVKKHSLCILKDISISHDGQKLKVSGDFANRLSTDTLQFEYKEYSSFLDILLTADKEICEFLNTFIYQHFKIIT